MLEIFDLTRDWITGHPAEGEALDSACLCACITQRSAFSIEPKISSPYRAFHDRAACSKPWQKGSSSNHRELADGDLPHGDLQVGLCQSWQGHSPISLLIPHSQP